MILSVLGYRCRMYRFVTQVDMCHDDWLHPSPCHLHQVFLLMLSLPRPPSRDSPWYVMFSSLCPCILIVQLPLKRTCSENMQYLVFCSCVSLLRMIVSSFSHILAKDRNSSFFMAAQYFMVYMCHIFLVRSISNGHLGWFQVFAIVNSAAMNIHVHVSLQQNDL